MPIFKHKDYNSMPEQVQENLDNIKTACNNIEEIKTLIENIPELENLKTQIDTINTNVTNLTTTIENMNKVIPTDIKYDDDGFTLYHDSVAITGQTEKIQLKTIGTPADEQKIFNDGKSNINSLSLTRINSDNFICTSVNDVFFTLSKSKNILRCVFPQDETILYYNQKNYARTEQCIATESYADNNLSRVKSYYHVISVDTPDNGTQDYTSVHLVFSIPSDNNIDVDSLTDLITLIGNHTYNCNGSLYYGKEVYIITKVMTSNSTLYLAGFRGDNPTMEIFPLTRALAHCTITDDKTEITKVIEKTTTAITSATSSIASVPVKETETETQETAYVSRMKPSI